MIPIKTTWGVKKRIKKWRMGIIGCILILWKILLKNIYIYTFLNLFLI